MSVISAILFDTLSSRHLPAVDAGNRLGQILDHRIYRAFVFNNVFMTQFLCCVEQDIAVSIGNIPSVCIGDKRIILVMGNHHTGIHLFQESEGIVSFNAVPVFCFNFSND